MSPDAKAVSVYLDTETLPWRDTPYEGVRWKKLRYEPDTGRSSVLLHFAAGATYGAHRHPAGEEYLVLEGSLEDGGRTYGPGTWVHHPPGSAHKPASRGGCVLFVTLAEPIEDLESAGDRPSR